MAQTDEPGVLASRAEKRLTRHGLRPRNAAILIVAVWLFFIVVFAFLEHLVDSKTFETVWQGMWWGTQTVSTVGYGDLVPQDPVGKVLGVILMVGGLSLITVLTATITTAFVTRAQADRTRAGKDPVMQQLEQLSAQLEELKAEVREGRREGR